ncbi:Monoamine oxidase N [Colletotrichum sp. SAR11_240]|nr:Monoamine oxidase N [Colletotrichum sp. SAR11_240]
MIDKTAEMPRSRDGFVWTPQSGFSYGLRTPAVVSPTLDGELFDKYDVIVIGAGFAGLSAARDLALAGKSVLLVEARDRIGGRTWTAYSERGESYEMGGTWIHWQQPHVFAEVQRYGLDDFIETNAVPEGCTIYSKANAADPVISRNSQEANKTLAKIEMLMARLLDVDGKGGRTVIPFPFDTRSSMRNNTLYSQIDELSIKDRVAQMTDLSQEERIMIEAHASSFFGIPSNDAAFSAVLYTYALCSFDPKTTEDAIMRYKLSKGTSSLALAILNDFKGHRIFSSLVKSISQTDEPYGVSVLLESGKEFYSKAVITTIPMTVLSRTEFNPPLSLLRRAAFKEGVVPTKMGKLLATTSTSLPGGYNIVCDGGSLPFASAFADGMRSGEPLLTFLTHPGHKLDSDEEKLRLIETLHPQGLTLTSARAHLWSEDPLAGGIMPVRKAGFLRKYYEEAHRPHGRVYFCGSDFADGWRGFISGAFESSYRVTREVLQHLNE